MKNNLEQIKKDLGIKNPNSRTQFLIYQSYFPDLEYRTFLILLRNGMLGRLFRGQEINLIGENIFIPFCWWRNEIFRKTNQYVPCVIKSENPYW